MRFATFLCWLLTASLGAFMLRTWLAHGGLRRERQRPGGLPPQLIFGHVALAVTGLLLWACYLLAGVRPLAWAAVALLTVAVGFGLATVTLWTPYPARRPGQRRDAVAADRPAGRADPADGATAEFTVTDEMIGKLLDGPSPGHGRGTGRPVRPNLAVLVPVAHGFGAIVTVALAVMAAIL